MNCLLILYYTLYFIIGHTHMGMLGSTALVEFDFFLDWAGKNIDNPLLKSGCTARTNKK